MFVEDDFFNNDDPAPVYCYHQHKDQQKPSVSRFGVNKIDNIPLSNHANPQTESSKVTTKTEIFPAAQTSPFSARRQFTAIANSQTQNFLYEEEEKAESKNTKTITFNSRPKKISVQNIDPKKIETQKTEFGAISNKQYEQIPGSIDPINDNHLNANVAGEEKQNFLVQQKQRLMDHQRMQNPSNGFVQKNEFYKYRNQEPNMPLYNKNEPEKTIEKNDAVYDAKNEILELQPLETDATPDNILFQKTNQTPRQQPKQAFNAKISEKLETENLIVDESRDSDNDVLVIQQITKRVNNKQEKEQVKEEKQEEVKQPDNMPQAPAKENEKTIPSDRLINLRHFGIPELIDIKAFLMNPAPKNYIIKCTIQRSRSGFLNFFSKYHLTFSVINSSINFPQAAYNEQRVLLSGKKKAGNKTSNYAITMDPKDFKNKSPNFLGKLRSNFMGTEYNIWNDGLNPKKTTSLGNMREQLGVVLYESNIFGKMKPRKMKVFIPSVPSNGEPCRFQPKSDKEGMYANYKSGKMDGIHAMFNKPPVWKEEIQGYVLSFGGRVNKPSVKNFQMIDEKSEDKIYLLFGKLTDNSFAMDFQWPLSPFQAFAVCLSSFDYKIGCE